MSVPQGPAASPPPGFRYEPEFVTAVEETALVEALARVTWADVVMRGQVARRRTAHFGWLYGYETWRIEPGPPPPAFVWPIRARAGALIGVPPETLAEVLLTEYQPGAGIGWHRDAPIFGVVVGVSLAAPCRFRLRRERGGAREDREVLLEPRSAYVLDGEVRWQWRHSIPPMKSLRYSLTFRTLRGK